MLIWAMTNNFCILFTHRNFSIYALFILLPYIFIDIIFILNVFNLFIHSSFFGTSDIEVWFQSYLHIFELSIQKFLSTISYIQCFSFFFFMAAGSLKICSSVGCISLHDLPYNVMILLLHFI